MLIYKAIHVRKQCFSLSKKYLNMMIYIWLLVYCEGYELMMNLTAYLRTISLKQINEFTCTDQHLNSEALIEKLKTFERTPYLMMWHDCATVGGCSYLFKMIACMYHPACYLTDSEYEEKYNISSNVQAIVENR